MYSHSNNFFRNDNSSIVVVTADSLRRRGYMCSHHTAMETLNLIMNSQGLHICRPAGRHRPPNRAVSVVCSMGTGLLWAN